MVTITFKLLYDNYARLINRTWFLLVQSVSSIALAQVIIFALNHVGYSPTNTLVKFLMWAGTALLLYDMIKSMKLIALMIRERRRLRREYYNEASDQWKERTNNNTPSHETI